MLVFNALRDLTATLYKLRDRTMHENVHAWSHMITKIYNNISCNIVYLQLDIEQVYTLQPH